MRKIQQNYQLQQEKTQHVNQSLMEVVNEVITTISMFCASEFDRRSKMKWFSIQVAFQMYSMPQKIPI